MPGCGYPVPPFLLVIYLGQKATRIAYRPVGFLQGTGSWTPIMYWWERETGQAAGPKEHSVLTARHMRQGFR